jgi:hypothetical protein
MQRPQHVIPGVGQDGRHVSGHDDLIFDDENAYDAISVDYPMPSVCAGD